MKDKVISRTAALLLVVVVSLLVSAGSLSAQESADGGGRRPGSEHVKHQGTSKREVQNAIAQTFRHHNRKMSLKNAQEYASYVIEAADHYSIDPALIAGLIIKESTGKPNARSKYAVGLMQIYWRLHRKSISARFPHIKTEADVMKPRNNIFVGTWLFSGYLKASGGDVSKALARYLGANSNRYISAVQGYRQQVLAKVQ